MSCAFVVNNDNDTILCHYTAQGWWPLQVALPAAEVASSASTDINQLGRVALLASLAPSHWASQHTPLDNPLNSPLNNPVAETQNLPATTAITHSYATDNGVKIPTLDEHHALVPYRQLIAHLPAALAAQLSQAIQLLRWQADTQFCSRCGAPVTISTAKVGEHAMVCTLCKLRQHPRVQPCIITAITRPNPQTGEMQILLAHHHRYGRLQQPLQYGLIAGFVEVGESLEHAVVREVAEEVNISIKDIRYVSSQPWPFPSNLMLGFRAMHESGDIVWQEEELSHANFFDISNLPKIPFKGSIAYDLIEQIVHEQGLSLDV